MKCGVDMVKISRIEKALSGDTGERFRAKVFTPLEIAYCESKGRGHSALQSYAARFAAKEAFAKAMGTGLGADVSLCEIEIENAKQVQKVGATAMASGKPAIRLSGATLALFTTLGFTQLELSLSHEDEYAVAFVVIS